MIALTETVRDIALRNPQSIRVFERFGIDYCCGGRKPLAEACSAGNLSIDEVLAALNAAAEETPATSAATSVDWAPASLRKLMEHIVATHHVYVTQELPRLAVLAQKVVNRHGDTQAHLLALQIAVGELDAELTPHLQKEELILFPYIAKFEAAIDSGSGFPDACFGTVANPIAMMTSEHEAAGAVLAEIQELSGNFTPPVGACPTYLAYYQGLMEFQKDLHQHIHLENNILFPRAVLMEASAMSATT
jgi:regulator of cell morphogenesis and NO signaling